MNAPTPLTTDQIAELVQRFYAKVRMHPQIGPVFNAAIEDWDAHLQTLTQFWSSVALKTATYRGNPMAAHRGHPIQAAHFDAWLALWRETTAQVLAPEHAALLVDYAERIGTSLRYGLGLEGHRRALDLPVLGNVAGKTVSDA